jgi:adenosylcobinamide-GDP ribazoletransferase
MRDSRAGAFGLVGVVLLLLVKYITLNSVPGNLMTAALLLMPVISRWAMVYVIVAYHYAMQEGLGIAFKQSAGWWHLVIATALALAFILLSSWFGGIAYYFLVGPLIMLAIWVIIVLVALYFKRKFSGLTGDTYGAINEIAEAGVLILVSMFAHNGWFV